MLSIRGEEGKIIQTSLWQVTDNKICPRAKTCTCSHCCKQTQNNWDSDLICLSSSEQCLDVMKLEWQGLVAITQHRLVLQHTHTTLWFMPTTNCNIYQSPLHTSHHTTLLIIHPPMWLVSEHSFSPAILWICNDLLNCCVSYFGYPKNSDSVRLDIHNHFNGYFPCLTGSKDNPKGLQGNLVDCWTHTVFTLTNCPA